MAFNVEEMKGSLVQGGARPSHFEVILTSPSNLGIGIMDSEFRFMCKAAQIPATTVGVIEVPYFGRKIKIAGDRTYAEWTPTIINDENFLIRNALEQWTNAINGFQTNTRGLGADETSESYKSIANVIQYGKTGNILREYTFYGLFPSEVAAIDLAWETTDTIEEYTATFQYDYWEVSGGSTGRAGGSGG